MNNVQLSGRLTADPELRYTPNGKATLNFRLAVQRPGKDAGADFITCQVWNGTAEAMAEYMEKGRLLQIPDGAIKQESWLDKNGERRGRLIVLARRIEFLPDDRRNKTSTDPEEEPGDAAGDPSEEPF